MDHDGSNEEEEGFQLACFDCLTEREEPMGWINWHDHDTIRVIG